VYFAVLERELALPLGTQGKSRASHKWAGAFQDPSCGEGTYLEKRSRLPLPRFRNTLGVRNHLDPLPHPFFSYHILFTVTHSLLQEFRSRSISCEPKPYPAYSTPSNERPRYCFNLATSPPRVSFALAQRPPSSNPRRLISSINLRRSPPSPQNVRDTRSLDRQTPHRLLVGRCRCWCWRLRGGTGAKLEENQTATY
jgi:hypothetical protein